MLGTAVFHGALYAQIEEESAAVSLEAYTDEFQEHFFEALKQKGIENYDKAINELLKCKQIDPDNPAVNHELAKTYLANGQAMQAVEYGIAALNSDPTNMWYLETLINSVLQQGYTLEFLNGRIPVDNKVLKENLALIFYKKNDFQRALELLKELGKSGFSDQLMAKINDTLERRDKASVTREETGNPLEDMRMELEMLMAREDFGTLDAKSAEALEQFPSLPYFYYVRGIVLAHNGNNEGAIAVLEEGLNYLLDDAALADKMYKTLASAYAALGNNSKANMYLSKIKSGS
jgi:tetratricopeptide (TPR) repeat protein